MAAEKTLAPPSAPSDFASAINRFVTVAPDHEMGCRSTPPTRAWRPAGRRRVGHTCSQPAVSDQHQHQLGIGCSDSPPHRPPSARSATATTEAN
jgi:hypothetical protein